jgi:hypothetical protein
MAFSGRERKVAAVSMVVSTEFAVVGVVPVVVVVVTSTGNSERGLMSDARLGGGANGVTSSNTSTNSNPSLE